MGNKSSLMLQDIEIKQISEETGFSGTQIEKLYTRFAHLDRTRCGTLTKNDLLSIPELAINPLCDRLIHMFFLDSDPTDERINFKQFIRVLATFKSSNLTTTMIYDVKEEPSVTGREKQDTTVHPGNRLRGKLTSRFCPKTRRNEIFSTNNPPSTKTTKTTNSSIDNMNERLREKLLFIFNIYDADNDGRISFNDLKSILKMMVGNFIEEIQLNKIATKAFLEVDKDNNGFIEFNEFCLVFNRKVLDDKLRVKFFT